MLPQTLGTTGSGPLAQPLELQWEMSSGPDIPLSMNQVHGQLALVGLAWVVLWTALLVIGVAPRLAAPISALGLGACCIAFAAIHTFIRRPNAPDPARAIPSRVRLAWLWGVTYLIIALVAALAVLAREGRGAI